MSWFLNNLIAAFLLPPLCLLLLAICGLIGWRRVAGKVLLTLALLGLWLTSTPYVADAALHYLEQDIPVLDASQHSAEAIVVLGGGSYYSAPEYGGDTVSTTTLERVRYAARLHRLSGKPVLVTGGTPMGNQISEAKQMQMVMEHEFNVPVRWTEDRSDNTEQNARYSYELLRAHGLRRIYLVSHAWHLPRAKRLFEAAGFEVIAAPTAYTTRLRTDILTFLPNGQSMCKSQIFAHELIGLLWYRLKSEH